MQAVAGLEGSGALLVAVHGVVYNVGVPLAPDGAPMPAERRFADVHPGGARILEQAAGTDATQQFASVGHSPRARGLMAPLAIAVMAGSAEAPTKEGLKEEKEKREAERQKWSAAWKCDAELAEPYRFGFHGYRKTSPDNVGAVVIVARYQALTFALYAAALAARPPAVAKLAVPYMRHGRTRPRCCVVSYCVTNDTLCDDFAGTPSLCSCSAAPLRPARLPRRSRRRDCSSPRPRACCTPQYPSRCTWSPRSCSGAPRAYHA